MIGTPRDGAVQSDSYISPQHYVCWGYNKSNIYIDM